MTLQSAYVKPYTHTHTKCSSDTRCYCRCKSSFLPLPWPSHELVLLRSSANENKQVVPFEHICLPLSSSSYVGFISAAASVRAESAQRSAISVGVQRRRDNRVFGSALIRVMRPIMQYEKGGGGWGRRLERDMKEGECVGGEDRICWNYLFQICLIWQRFPVHSRNEQKQDNCLPN